VNFDRQLTRTLVIPAATSVLFFVLGVATWHPRSIIMAGSILAIGASGVFSLSAIPQALHLLVSNPSYRNPRNLSCFIAGAVPAIVSIALLLLFAWAVIDIGGIGMGVMPGA